jgi:hypothetical protein
MNYQAGREALGKNKVKPLTIHLWERFYNAGPVTFDELFEGCKPQWAVTAYKVIKANRWVDVDDHGVVRCLMDPRTSAKVADVGESS